MKRETRRALSERHRSWARTCGVFWKIAGQGSGGFRRSSAWPAGRGGTPQVAAALGVIGFLLAAVAIESSIVAVQSGVWPGTKKNAPVGRGPGRRKAERCGRRERWGRLTVRI